MKNEQYLMSRIMFTHKIHCWRALTKEKLDLHLFNRNLDTNLLIEILGLSLPV